MSQTIVLGKVGLVPKGAYDPTLTYKRNDFVLHGSTSYVAKTDVSAGKYPDQYPEYWGVLADGRPADAAAKRANKAADRAERSAGDADTAKAEALAAKEGADGAAANTNEAIRLASLATQAANDAAASVDESKDNANTAASEARNAAALAERKAQDAESATSEAVHMVEVMDGYAEVVEEWADAEAGRVTAEKARATTESARISAELTRVSAESARVDAEYARVAAETARENTFLTMQTDVETATLSATSAANAANAKAGLANTAATNANEKAELANTAAAAANTAAESASAYGTRMAAVETAIGTLEMALGKYDDITDTDLSAAVANKYVNVSGAESTQSGYAISVPVRLSKGNIYLFPSSSNLSASVSVFARKVTRTYDKVIDYAYTYDGEERVATATADYDATLVYTYSYDGEDMTITDRDGNVVASLPATRVVTESFYDPLFKAGSASRPASGCYVYLCPEDMDIVVTGLTDDIANGTLVGLRFALFASIATNYVGAPGQAALGQMIGQLDEQVEVLLSGVDIAGRHKAISYCATDVPGFTVGGCPLVLYGNGAPSGSTIPEQRGYPAFVGQMYINVDASSGGLYYAIGTDGTNRWKQA